MTDRDHRAATRAAVRHDSVHRRFDLRDNGLNLIRLVLAALVILSHSWPAAGWGPDPRLGDLTLGSFAVCGFFGISGYLIAGSRDRTRFGRFLWARLLRVFPGYLFCLVLTAFVFSVLVAAVNGGWSPGVAVSYVVRNAKMFFGTQAVIGRTVADLPYSTTWNGSLWTLRWELTAYALTGLLGFWAAARRSPLPATALFVLVTVALAGLRLTGHESQVPVLMLFGFFLAGMLVLRWGHRIPLTGSGVLLCLLVITAGCLTGTAVLVAGPPLVYVCLWLAARIPRAITRPFSAHDVSYGVYLYGFPAQQLLVTVVGARALTPWVFAPGALVLALPFAALSWFAVERPAMRLRSAVVAPRPGVRNRPRHGQRPDEAPPNSRATRITYSP